MPRAKSTRGKRYRPRTPSPDAGLGALLAAMARADDARPLEDDQLTDLAAAYWLALDAMVRGASGEEEWSVVTCVLNVALVLAENGIGKAHEQDFVAALDGAFRAKVRAAHKQVWRLDGDALAAIRTALHLHDQQMTMASRVQVRAAMSEVHRRINSGLVYDVTTT